MKPDFAGYVTRYNQLCTDGVTIKPGAFKEYHGKKIPLVWNHSHNEPQNVLGHVALDERPDGVYGRVFLNESPNAKATRDMVLHGDVSSFSIYANQLVKHGMDVLKGKLHEVSVVLSGANSGAFIDYVSLQHDAAGNEIVEAILYFDEDITHGDDLEESEDETKAPVDEEVEIIHNDQEETVAKATPTEEGEETVETVLATLTDKQRIAVNYVFSELLNDDEDDDEEFDSEDDEADVADSDDTDEQTPVQHSDTQGETMARNVFDSTEPNETPATVLSHSDVTSIMATAVREGSLKEAVLAHAAANTITNIDSLFPDAKATDTEPQLLKRDGSWVEALWGAVRKTPFAKVKTFIADVTADEARARGYTKGGLKAEEVIALLKRTTSPTTIYKKQKLDRDDIIDITDFDIVVWLKAEMKTMLIEEVARAILIGDGRTALSPDKIKDPAGQTDGVGIRSILNDHVLYAETVYVPEEYADDADLLVDAVVRARKRWKGTGKPSFFSTIDVVADLSTHKDSLGRRVYESDGQLANAMRVSNVVEVEVMEEEEDLLGIMVNPADYTVGSVKGGELSFFDDFDIDYNQMKYLFETRLSGALHKPKSAVIFKVGTAPVGP